VSKATPLIETNCHRSLGQNMISRLERQLCLQRYFRLGSVAGIQVFRMRPLDPAALFFPSVRCDRPVYTRLRTLAPMAWAAAPCCEGTG